MINKIHENAKPTEIIQVAKLQSITKKLQKHGKIKKSDNESENQRIEYRKGRK